MDYYSDLFDSESDQSKLLSKIEKTVFILTFFLLDIEGKHTGKTLSAADE